MNDEKQNLEYEYSLIGMTEKKECLDFILFYYSLNNPEEEDQIINAYEEIKKYTNTNHFKNYYESNYLIKNLTFNDLKEGDVIYTKKFIEWKNRLLKGGNECYYQIVKITPKQIYIKNLLCHPIFRLFINEETEENDSFKNKFICVIKKDLFINDNIKILKKTNQNDLEVLRFNDFIYKNYSEHINW